MTPEESLRLRLSESIPEGGTSADTLFDSATLQDILTAAGGDLDRAAYAAWEIKAAHYADLVNVTEGNASRQMSDLHGHALQMLKHYEKSSNTLVDGRTRVGRIRRRPY